MRPALITGCSGIGRATALRLVRGATVLATARRPAKGAVFG
jgi:NAD(P)-dependent dehydrogenase (short-subunit alcohol dehydrogenase family)